jgi:methylase of polypeptide subunit release factors
VAALPRYLDRRAVWRIWLAWRFRTFQRHRHRRLALETVAGVHLVVLPDVFNPALFFSSRALADVIDKNMVRSGMKVLDMGTGSGVAAILAARCGADVVAVDVSPEAVRCARINVLLNRLERHVDIRQGDLFDCVAGERFDLVFFNPPYYQGNPQEPWEYAWRSDDALGKFARGLPGALSPGGRAVLVLSTETAGIDTALSGSALESRLIRQRDIISERLTVVEWRPAAKVVTS